MYFVYVLRCRGSSLYCGSTNDVQKRIAAHLGTDGKGAKYTRSRKPERVEAVWATESKGAALKLEYNFKKLKKDSKEKLIRSEIMLEELFSDRLETQLYTRSSEYEREL